MTGMADNDLFCCPECKCTDIQVTAWVEANGGKDAGGDPPLDDVWCPQCDCDVRTLDMTDKLKPYTPLCLRCGKDHESVLYLDCQKEAANG